MSKKLLAAAMVFIPVLIAAGIVVFSLNHDIAIINPSGEIGRRQSELLVFAFLLSMVVIIPVFALTIFIVLRYSANNKKATYRPNWGHDNKLEAIWWGIPVVIILILSIITWRTSHTLDPYKPLDNPTEPLEVQVVAMRWKWLFLYPEHNIATVNHLEIPEDTPINFTITADAPMNSFWIPKLGGQIYAMSGMSTKLHLIANEIGEYEGLSANISGEEFANMRFKVHANTKRDFNDWISARKSSGPFLDQSAYLKLSSPGINTDPIFYSGFTSNLYDTIIGKYMAHDNSATEQREHEGGH